MTVEITDLVPLSDDELQQRFMQTMKELLALAFSVDINKLDTAKVKSIRDLIYEADFPFEPTPPGEPVGEIYHGDKLVGYIM